MKKVLFYATLACILFSASSCHNTTVTDAQRHEINLANFDTTIKPGDNFFEYVNGNWLKNNPIPSSEAKWGSFDVANDTSLHRLHKILNRSCCKKG